MTLTADATFWTAPTDWAPGSVIKLAETQYLTLGDSGQWHLVDLKAGRCSCPHYRFRLDGTDGRCRHVHHVDEFLNLPICSACSGRGSFGPHRYTSDGHDLLRCPECNGLGRVSPSKAEIPSESALKEIFR